MLHTPLELDPVVDDEAAREFMKEATKVATGTELESIGARLEAKSQHFRAVLARERLATLDEETLAALLRHVFTLKRKSKRLVARNGIETLRAQLDALLYGEADVAARFDAFIAGVTGLEKAMIVSLASEALHFTDPGRYWLWTHWIWSPKTGTGALPLVIRKGVELEAPSDGAVYLKVGRALARVDQAGHAAGYSRSGRGLFGTDVFLACVYAVYMFTVFRVKLSNEFNRILPELPELVERVLGVHWIGRETAETTGVAMGEANG